MAREISIAKSKRTAKDLRIATAEVARLRAEGLRVCAADRGSRDRYSARATAIGAYCNARRWQIHFRALLNSSVVVKGVTRHYTGCRFAA